MENSTLTLENTGLHRFIGLFQTNSDVLNASMISKITSGIFCGFHALKKISGTTPEHPNPMLQDVLQKPPPRYSKLGNIEPSPTKPENAHFQNKKITPKRPNQLNVASGCPLKLEKRKCESEIFSYNPFTAY